MPRWPRLLLLLVVVPTGLARFHGLGAIPLWHDEAWVAVSLVQPSLREMLTAFPYPQTTPPLFLLAARGLVSLLGPHDAVFRLLPALAGLASILLIHRLTRRLARNETAGLLAAAWWGTNPVVLRYAQELKQYSSDACVTLLLLYLAERYAEQGSARARNRWMAGLVGASLLCIGLSHTAVIVLAVVVARLGLPALRASAPGGERRRVAALAGCTAALFLAQYLLLVRPQILPWVVAFWSDRFPASLEPRELAAFAYRSTRRLFSYLFGGRWDAFFGGRYPHLAFAAFVAGCAAFARRRDAVALAYVGLPFAVTLAASALRLYPYGGVRADLFLAPLLFVAAACGVAAPLEALARRPRLRPVAGALAAAVILAFPLLAIFGTHFEYGKRREDVRSVVEDYRRHVRAEDFTAVHPAAEWAFEHYHGLDGLERTRRVGGWHTADLDETRRDLDAILAHELGGGRLWLVFSRERAGEPMRAAIVAHVEARCERLRAREFENAASYLFRCPGAGR